MKREQDLIVLPPQTTQFRSDPAETCFGAPGYKSGGCQSRLIVVRLLNWYLEVTVGAVRTATYKPVVRSRYTALVQDIELSLKPNNWTCLRRSHFGEERFPSWLWWAELPDFGRIFGGDSNDTRSLKSVTCESGVCCPCTSLESPFHSVSGKSRRGCSSNERAWESVVESD